MVRMCLRTMAACAVSLFASGCTGQNIEGAWLGPMPFADADACRIKIYSGDRFDVSCGGEVWVGAGRYTRHGDRLSLKFDALVHRGEVQKRLPSFAFTFEGMGNHLKMADPMDMGKPFEWARPRM